MSKQSNSYDLIVIGGGAAGFFGAIRSVQESPNLKILILEKAKQILSKVKISGGGRCNVTHACFDPTEMVTKYPRGHKELLGPFHQFLCGDMMAWLEDKGVPTKIEEDGRIFPVTDKSQSIIDCFTGLCKKYQIEIKTQSSVTSFKREYKIWQVTTKDENYKAKNILIATGSSTAFWNILGKMGYTIVPPVPSLFTFNIKHPLLKDLPGLAVPNAEVKINNIKFEESGPLLITHWGLSGPAVLKLSAWAARELHAKNYKFNVAINWSGQAKENIMAELERNRKQNGKKLVSNLALANLPKRLWQRMLQVTNIPSKLNYASLNAKQIAALIEIIGNCSLQVNGKSTFKDEFVTCGGVDNKQVNFKTMESKLHPNLYFAGEVLNIDAVTGGFNFQAAWTTAYLAAKQIAQNQ